MKVEVQNPEKITMKNGKTALSGTCPKCGGKVFKIGGCQPLPDATWTPRRAPTGALAAIGPRSPP